MSLCDGHSRPRFSHTGRTLTVTLAFTPDLQAPDTERSAVPLCTSVTDCTARRNASGP